MKARDPRTYYDAHAHHQQHLRPVKVRERSSLFDTLTVHDWVHEWVKNTFPFGGRALDIGCAQLQLLQGLGDRFSRRVGVDIAESRAVWSRHPEIETHVVDLDRSDLPFESGSFDLVTITMVLEHVFDVFHAVAEVRRVLAVGGMAIVQVPNLAGIRHRLSLAAGRLPITASSASFKRQSWDGQHIHNFTQGSLTWLLRTMGLEPDAWGLSGRAARLRAFAPNLLGQDLIVRCRPTDPRKDLPLRR